MKIIKKFLSIVLIVTTALVLLCSCGPKVKNGFVEENGYTYYYVNDEMQIGWHEIDGDWYYFLNRGVQVESNEYPKGSMIKDLVFKDVDYKEYFFDSNGKMIKNQFVDIKDGNKCYFGSDGAMVTNTQKEINGEIYNFDSDGVATRVPGTRTLTLFGNYRIVENYCTEISDEKEIIIKGNRERNCKLTNFTRIYPWEWNCDIEFLGNKEIEEFLPFAFVSDEFYSFGEIHFEYVNRISDKKYRICGTFTRKYADIDNKDRNYIIKFMY